MNEKKYTTNNVLRRKFSAVTKLRIMFCLIVCALIALMSFQILLHQRFNEPTTSKKFSSKIEDTNQQFLSQIPKKEFHSRKESQPAFLNLAAPPEHHDTGDDGDSLYHDDAYYSNHHDADEKLKRNKKVKNRQHHYYAGEDMAGLGLAGKDGSEIHNNSGDDDDDAKKLYSHLLSSQKHDKKVARPGHDQENRWQLSPSSRRHLKQYLQYSKICANALPFLKTGLLFSFSEFDENHRAVGDDLQNNLPEGFFLTSSKNESATASFQKDEASSSNIRISFDRQRIIQNVEKNIPLFTRKAKAAKPKYAVVMLSAMGKNMNNDNHDDFKNSSFIANRSMMKKYSFINKIQYCKKHGYDLIIEDDAAVDSRRAVQWSKIRVVQKWLASYEWVLMVDEDTLFTNFETTIESLIGGEAINDYASYRANQIYDRFERDGGNTSETNDDTGKFASGGSAEKRLAFVIDNQKQLKNDVNMILARDFKNLNTGVVFYKNTNWTHRFLERMWNEVPTADAEAKNGYHDQGALIALLQPRRYVRSIRGVAKDLKHIWVVENPEMNNFNKYPENMIIQEANIEKYKWRTGDWIIHFASCKYFPTACPNMFKFFFEQALCSQASHRSLLRFGGRRNFWKFLVNRETKDELLNFSDGFIEEHVVVAEKYYPPLLAESSQELIPTFPPLSKKLK